jgi:hypothetical protein
MPPLLLPTLNSVGAEIGKPIAPQTASVGVSTSKFVRKEGDVIRHNMGVLLAIGFYLARPAVMTARLTVSGRRGGQSQPRSARVLFSCAASSAAARACAAADSAGDIANGSGVEPGKIAQVT